MHSWRPAPIGDFPATGIGTDPDRNSEGQLQLECDALSRLGKPDAKRVIEVIIERWTNSDGQTDYRSSVWMAVHRVHMGAAARDNANECEADALGFCWRALGQKPDKISQFQILR